MEKHYLNHRNRLRERFNKTNGKGVADYELIELLLFLARPRGDTKPIAKQLFEKFSTINGILWADSNRLKEIKGVGDSSIHVIKLTQKILEKMLQERVIKKPILSSWHQVIEYARVVMGYDSEEQFRILFLDNKNQLIADEVQQKGTINQSPVYPREVIKRALELGSAAIILMHNHPSGDPTPSKQDVEITKLIKEAGEKLGITIHDHVIIGKYEHRSLRSMNLM